MQCFQIRLQRGQVEPARALARQAESAARDLAAEADLLQIEEPRRPLQVCQSVRIDRYKPLEIRLRRDLEAQQIEETLTFSSPSATVRISPPSSAFLQISLSTHTYPQISACSLNFLFTE